MKKHWESFKQDVRNFFSYIGEIVSGASMVKDQKSRNDTELFTLSEFGDKMPSYKYSLGDLVSKGVSQKGLNKALMMASISNQPKTVKVLIENGAKPETVLYGLTRFDDISPAVSKALREYDQEEVAKAVEENQQKALKAAEKFNKPAVRKTVFDRQYENMDIHEKGKLMTTAIAQGNWATMQIVLMHSDFSKNTAWYDSAIAFGSERMVESEKDRDLYRNQVLGLFIAKGADVNTMDGYCLRLATKSGDIKTVQFLINKGADVNVKDGYCLRLAARSGGFKTVDLLLNNGADPMAGNGEALSFALVHGQTALFDRMAPVEKIEFTKEKEVQLLGTALLSQNWDTVSYVCERFKQLPMSTEQVKDCFGFVCANGRQIFERMEQSKGQETVFSMYIDYKRQQAAAQQKAAQQPANENAQTDTSVATTPAVEEKKAQPASTGNKAVAKKQKAPGANK